MNVKTWRRLGTAALLCALLVACGSGDSDDDDSGQPNPPATSEPVLRCAP